MHDELMLDKRNLYNSPDPNVIRSRLIGPYRISLYGDTFWRVECRTDDKHIPDSLAGAYTGPMEMERAVKAALATEEKNSGQ